MLSAFKYASILSLPLTVAVAFSFRGLWTFLPVIYVFGVIPIVELLFNPVHSNVSIEEEEKLLGQQRYDFLLYLILPIQWGFVYWFLMIQYEGGISFTERIGLVTGMGMLSGAMAINVAHELGHRRNWYERLMAKTLLLSSLYNHFFIEHNRGHHRYVGTPSDPATARYNETIFAFWFRSIWGQYINAWRLEFKRLNSSKPLQRIVNNEMYWYLAVQIGLCIGITMVFDVQTTFFFIGSAGVGILLLETVNYIEHYGLQRNRVSEMRYERVLPMHSWNSDHQIGRALLFELSRHSDHHYLATRKYQILRYHKDSPQMPTGYPGMMLLALFPPLFFRVVNPLIQR